MIEDESQSERSSTMELWGGVECTVNRVQNNFMDQLARSGHLTRQSDFPLFKEMGVTTLRHSVLWERTAPNGLSGADWTWSDLSLSAIRELKIRPIVGLVHHGSGPRHTSLLDTEFPEKLAAYASAVASRYPWVQDYTPVNEPLTTARFSALYGHWYPHAHDDLSFARALFNQCRAVVLAMRAIRKVNPSARLVQTDDLGKTFSTPKLAYQAEFENARRWSTFDLLLGCVDHEHPLWSYFEGAGINLDELKWFLDNPCPPDILGINHYLSGERYLDEHLGRYPSNTHGGNGRDRYADVLAARVRAEGASGPESLLLESWNRYGLPIAVTECHNGCTREEQLRWFLEVWNAALAARSQGAEVLAVTAWSLMGAFDWNNLVTREDHSYEPGVFDIRAPQPRPTALVDLARRLAGGSQPKNPVLEEEGWWKRSSRFVYGMSVDENGRSSPVPVPTHRVEKISARPLVILGPGGAMRQTLAKACEARGISHHLFNRAQHESDLRKRVKELLVRLRPWAVINVAGYSCIDNAELDRERCYHENTEVPMVVAEECAERGVRLVTFSSELVFSGDSARPYVESDQPRPLNYYGSTKTEAEARVSHVLPSALIVRPGWLFGPWNEDDLFTASLRSLRAGETVLAAADNLISPTYIPDLVNATLDLLIDGEQGVWHLANDGAMSSADLVQRASDLCNVSCETLHRCSAEEMRSRARRPKFTVLGSERGWIMPKLEDALLRFTDELDMESESRSLAA